MITEPGHYWVKHEGHKTIGEFDGRKWWLPGEEYYFKEEDLEIGLRVPSQETWTAAKYLINKV